MHFVHRRSEAPAAIPLLFVHGFPESFIGVAHIIDALCNPIATPPRGETDAQPFHVVAPSIPGFGFSDAVPEEGNNVQSTAHLFDALIEALGYRQYIVHGSGWYVLNQRRIDQPHPLGSTSTSTRLPGQHAAVR